MLTADPADAVGGVPCTNPQSLIPNPRSPSMFPSVHRLIPLEDRGPLRVMFVITCMPVGGAETLLVELIRRMDRARLSPELCCLKYFGPLGEVLAREVPRVRACSRTSTTSRCSGG